MLQRVDFKFIYFSVDLPLRESSSMFLSICITYLAVLDRLGDQSPKRLFPSHLFAVQHRPNAIFFPTTPHHKEANYV